MKDGETERLWHRCFPLIFVEFLRSAVLIEHLWWLLLFLSKGRDELDAITAKL